MAKAYSDEFVAGAILMLEAAGYGEQPPRGLLAVSKNLKVPENTLRRWFRGSRNTPPAKVVTHKRIDFREAIRDELNAIFDAASNVREEASYRDLMVAAGIMVDKMQLLEGKPTERSEVVNIGEHRERIVAGLARRAEQFDAGTSAGVSQRPVG